MHATVDVRLAGPEHAEELMPLVRALNELEGVTWKPTVMEDALRRLLRERSLGLLSVARDRTSGALVGYALATFGYDIEFGGRDALLTELFVVSSWRGRGLGRLLLDHAELELRSHGARAVHLMVRPENDGARALYTKRGFAVAPRIMMTKPLVADDEGGA